MPLPNLNDLWKSLTTDERERACRDFVSDEDADAEECNNCYARFARIRVSFWIRKSREERAHDLSRVLHLSEFKKCRPDVLKAYLLGSKVRTLCDFLDALGIPHTDGRFEEAAPPSRHQLERAAEQLRENHPTKDLWLYFGFLLIRDSEGLWNDLLPVFESVDKIYRAEATNTAPAEESAPQSGSEPEPNPLPDSPDDFTTLDELVVKSIVAAAGNTEGSFSRQKIDDLVDEVVSLNGDRKRSYFHRGYFHALFDVGFEFSFAAENHERRSWYMAGVLMGLLRQGAPATEEGTGRRYIDDVIRTQRGIVEELVTDDRLGCGKLIAPSIYPYLIAAGESALAATMVEKQAGRLSYTRQLDLMRAVLSDGARFLREGKLGEAALLLRQAFFGLSMLVQTEECDESHESAYREALRKMGQCEQALGNFTDAKRFLEAVAAMPDCEERREALTDLGLISAGFKSLRSILPGKASKGWPIIVTSLKAGKSYFDHAVQANDGQEVRGVRNAHFALGVLAILGQPPDSKTAVAHFERAYAGMLRRREAYRVGGLIEWTRFFLALSHLEQLDPAFAAKARDLIEESIDVGDQFPIEFWQRSLDAAAMLDDVVLSQRIVEYLFEKRSAEAFIAIKGSSALLRSELLRRRYNEMLETDQRLPLAERFNELKALLRICQKEGDFELAGDVLGSLEEFALTQSPFSREFEALLERPEGYSPGWESEEAEMSRARILESTGRLPDAATIYARRFYALTEKGSAHCLAQAAEYLDKIEKLGGQDGVVEMRNRLAACERAIEVNESSITAEAELRSGAKLCLLYVGGNEIQEAFDDRISQRLRGDYPGLRILFAHPGWGSNWSRALDQVKRLVPEADAVVLSPLVRTQFGRNLRKCCDAKHPWLASTAKGQSGIRESIKRFAIWTMARKSGTAR